MHDPNKTYHLQVHAGATVVYEHHAFGDRSTLQVPGRDVDALLATGDVYEVAGGKVPDVGAARAVEPEPVAAPPAKRPRGRPRKRSA